MKTMNAWLLKSHRLALQGHGPDRQYDQPAPAKTLGPEDFPEHSPERALAIRLGSLTGHAYDIAERALVAYLQITSEIEELLEEHGYPVDPHQLDMMRDEWSEHQDYYRERI